MTKYLITGASRGIGLELVRQLLDRDTTEFVFAASRSGSKQLKDLANHPKLKLVELDVSDEETIKKAAEKLKPYKINVLVNNAGVNASGSSLTTTSEGALEAFRINVVGPLLVTKYFLPLLETDSTKPAIIANISSLLASLKEATNSDYQFFENVPYRVSKAALNMLTRLQSLELKDKNIVVVSFSPGWVSTDMGGPTAPVTPKESVEGLIKGLDRVQIEDTGKFLDYTGVELPL